MDTIRNILAANRKVGPPIPPRPSPAAVAQALQQKRNGSPEILQQQNGRTVIYKSPSFSSTSKIQQQKETFDNNKNQLNESSENTSTADNGVSLDIAKETSTISNNNNYNNNNYKNEVIIVSELNVKPAIFPRKSPVALPRLKTPPTRAPPPPPVKNLEPSPQKIIVNGSELNNFQTSFNKKSVENMNEFIRNNIYYGVTEATEEEQTKTTETTKDFMNNNITYHQPSSNSSTLSYSSTSTTARDPDYQSCFEVENNQKNLDDNKFKEKLFKEIFIKSKSEEDEKLCEASNNHVKYLKRSNSFDYLCESEGSEKSHFKTLNSKMPEKSVAFHEILISELTEMRKSPDSSNKNLLNTGRMSSKFTQSTPDISLNDSRIKNSNIIDVDNNGEKVYSSCYISLEDSGLEDEEKLDDCSSSGVGDSWEDADERVNMSLPGLPPLPKSLSGFELAKQQQLQTNNYHNLVQLQQNQLLQQQQQQSVALSSTMNSFDSQRSLSSLSSSSINRKHSTLDTQLAILRREMYGLRQLDLSLLSQLWALNESIQEFRTILQEQENLSPQSPSPSNSDINSLASDEENVNEDNNNNNHLTNNNLLSKSHQQHNGNGNSGLGGTESKSEHDFIEDMHQQLEKQIQRMRVAPPEPPPVAPRKSAPSTSSRPV